MGADDAQHGHGRPRVELLALVMRANLLVHGMEIVFDGKRGQIIYRKEEPREQEEEKGQGDQVGVYTVIYISWMSH
jgi:hypothetical protein